MLESNKLFRKKEKKKEKGASGMGELQKREIPMWCGKGLTLDRVPG